MRGVLGMPIRVPARQEFVILTHVRSGSSLLADLMTRNGIGHAEEHLNQRALAKADRSWSPEEVLAAARCKERGDFFGSKVMVHWLDDLKRHAGIPAATDAQILRRLFAEGFVTIHLYRSDTVAAAVSFTLAELSGRWHRVDGKAVGYPSGDTFRLPTWAAMEPLISDNVAWLDACKERLHVMSAELEPRVVEIRYEDLAAENVVQFRRAVNAIPGAVGRSLTSVSGHSKLANALSEELCLQWRAEHPGYAPARQEQNQQS
jgi:LPS sulfotransferase NodH